MGYAHSIEIDPGNKACAYLAFVLIITVAIDPYCSSPF